MAELSIQEAHKISNYMGEERLTAYFKAFECYSTYMGKIQMKKKIMH